MVLFEGFEQGRSRTSDATINYVAAGAGEGANRIAAANERFGHVGTDEPGRARQQYASHVSDPARAANRDAHRPLFRAALETDRAFTSQSP